MLCPEYELKYKEEAEEKLKKMSIPASKKAERLKENAEEILNNETKEVGNET